VRHRQHFPADRPRPDGDLQEAIKRDLLLSDGQLGLLSGLGFAPFFGGAGLPIGGLVDRYSRRVILVGAILVIRGATALGGTVGSFAVVGAAIGSMLADSLPSRKTIGRSVNLFWAHHWDRSPRCWSVAG
jgi:MFS family permease